MMKTRFAIAVIFALLSALASADIPPAMEDEGARRFHTLVDVEFVAGESTLPKLYGVAIVDTRPTEEGYDPGHIPTAISIPDDQFQRRAILLPRARSTLLIFYCEDEGCSSAHRSAYKAERLGYHNVKVYAGGYQDWRASKRVASVSVPYLKKLIDARAPVTIVDTRNRERHYERGHIPGAVSIPAKQFAKLTGLLPEDLAAPIYFYCDGLDCGSSAGAAEKAVALGYTAVMTVPDGYSAWKHLYGAAAMAQGEIH
jgi:rhodanese-related sulfurtransferase